MPIFLIADDSPEKTEFLQGVLARAAWQGEVLTADTTEDAMAIIDEHPIDAAFIDYYIPSGNGPCVIAYLKRMRPLARIALVSSSANADNFARAKAAGAEATVCTFPREDAEERLLELLGGWFV